VNLRKTAIAGIVNRSVLEPPRLTWARTLTLTRAELAAIEKRRPQLLTVRALICTMRAILCGRVGFVLTDTHQQVRRTAIVRILRAGLVRKQQDLVRLLKKEGHEVTQSSVSRDLRDMGALKASGRYALPSDEVTRANGDFGTLAQFVRGMRRAGPSITILKTTTGAAQSVAVAIDKAEWPEVAGTISGDDTIFIATANARAQDELVGRLHSIFRV
jgi:transcriptional regulator of arginine metabolism